MVLIGSPGAVQGIAEVEQDVHDGDQVLALNRLPQRIGHQIHFVRDEVLHNVELQLEARCSELGSEPRGRMGCDPRRITKWGSLAGAYAGQRIVR